MSLTFEDIYREAGKKSSVMMVPSEGVVFICDFSGHTKHIYRKQENGLFSEEIIDLHKMALKLAEGLDKVEFMKDVLKTMPVEQILELKDLLPMPETTVTSKKGCFNLIVTDGNKKSRIMLR